MKQLLRSATMGAAFLVAFFTATFGSSIAFAADVVASPFGHDFFGNGTAASPFRSLSKAMGSAVPGDRVLLMPGDYTEASGENFPVPMKPDVALIGSGTANTRIATTDDPALVFVYGNFDADSRVDGVTIRGLTNDTYTEESGIVIVGESYGGYVSTMSPVITNTVIEGFEEGVFIGSGGDNFFPVDVSPTIENSIIRNFYNSGIQVYIDNPDSSNLSVTGNLLQGANGDGFYDTTGVDVFTAGGDGVSPNYGGGMVTATIKNNTIENTYYGVQLAGEAGDQVAPAPPKLTGAKFTTGGQIHATVSNNVIHPGFRDDGTGISVFGEGARYGDEYYPGCVELTANRNTIHDYYGIYLDTSDGVGSKPGGNVSATITNNEIVETYAYEQNGYGIAVDAATHSTVVLSASGNHIQSNYGIYLDASGADTDAGSNDSYGGFIDATIAGNVIDSLATGYAESNYAIYARAGAVEPPSYYYYDFGCNCFVTDYASMYGESGGKIDLSISDSVLTGTYGVNLEAGGPFSFYAYDGGGGTINADLVRNSITGINRYQYGMGVYAGAGYSFYATNNQTGGTTNVSLINNVVRGYDAVRLEGDGFSTADASGEVNASLINNTLIGGSIAYGYPDGGALAISGGNGYMGVHPTVVNNILQNTQFTYAGTVDSDGSVNNDPIIFDYNLLFGRSDSPLTELSGASQGTIGSVNALGLGINNIAGAPQFTCPGEEAFSLRDTSPAIDAADALLAPANDIVGNPRPVGGVADIGAHEFQGSSGPIFQDVPLTHVFYQYISAIYNAGITGGCSNSPKLYCPDATVSREQMAIFLIRALGEQPDSSAPQRFLDVPQASFSYGYVERLAQLGITGGCVPGYFCPLDPVTRAQMAVFIDRALGEGPLVCSGVFNDVNASNPFCGWIEKLAALGITGGCGLGAYCPDLAVSRGQMGVFLARAFNLMLPVSCAGLDPSRIAAQDELFPEGQLGADDSLKALDRSALPYELAVARGGSSVTTASGTRTRESTAASLSGSAADSVRLASGGVSSAVPGSIQRSAVASGVSAGVVGHTGPVFNDRLNAESAVAAVNTRSSVSEPRQKSATGTSRSKRLTRTQRGQLDRNIAAQELKLRQAGNKILLDRQLRKQEKALLRGEAIDPKLQAKWDARLKHVNERHAARKSGALKTEGAADLARWKAKLGASWPGPKTKLRQSPGVVPGPAPSVERAR